MLRVAKDRQSKGCIPVISNKVACLFHGWCQNPWVSFLGVNAGSQHGLDPSRLIEVQVDKQAFWLPLDELGPDDDSKLEILVFHNHCFWDCERMAHVLLKRAPLEQKNGYIDCCKRKGWEPMPTAEAKISWYIQQCQIEIETWSSKVIVTMDDRFSARAM